jgi:hypothetical protein
LVEQKWKFFLDNLQATAATASFLPPGVAGCFDSFYVFLPPKTAKNPGAKISVKVVGNDKL